jgi:NADH:ubiquinone oxidoreductase subunit C
MSRLPADLETRLAAAAPAGIRYRRDCHDKGLSTAWCLLGQADDLRPVVATLKDLGARLSTLTVFQPKAAAQPAPAEGQDAPPPATFFGGQVSQDGKAYEIAYHFDLDGDTLTVTVHVPPGGAVDSLTPLYRAADWPEREAMEMYALTVRDHPDPRRLFLDPGIEAAAFERLIPYSTLVNSAASKSLWEKIIAGTAAAAGATP